MPPRLIKKKSRIESQGIKVHFHKVTAMGLKFIKYILGFSIIFMSITAVVLMVAKFNSSIRNSLKTPGNDSKYVSLGYDTIGTAVRPNSLDGNNIPVNSERYTIELGISKSKENAEKILDSLAEKGFTAFYTPVQRQDGTVIFRLRFGLFEDEAEATQNVSKISTVLPFKGRVVKI